VESGTVSVEMAEVGLASLRSDLLRDFEHVARAKGLAYSVDLAPGCPTSIATDPQRLRQILANLLANAFKFTESGTVRVQVGLADDGWNADVTSLEGAPSVIALSVTDSGIGIDEDQQLRIFEAFAQGDGSTARLYGGTGLGLSISRELSALLGGQLSVTSSPGVGSTFTVYLPSVHLPSRAVATGPVVRALPIAAPTVMPAVPVEPAHARPTEAAPRPSGETRGVLEGVKILVVDDEIRNLYALSALLGQAHAVVSFVESGTEAIAALVQNDVDIVLMDILMPEMDGYDTIRAIRAIDRFASLPIVALTAKAAAGERQRCLDAGANDYVARPAEASELLAALRPWIPSTPVWLGSVGVGDGDRPALREVSEIEGLQILVVDDDFRNIFAMTALLERLRADVIAAENGAEAIAVLERTPDVDVVLMDIMMPVMDGYETMRAIRAMEQFAALPIIAFTGKSAAGERQRCLDAGANDYIPKPVDTQELLTALRPWLPPIVLPAA
ncbi:MAG: hypothetical protein QOE63_427, partial [Acidimicrobiaceae bacterium]